MMVSSMNLGIQQHVLLAPYTSWKIGGPASWFVKAEVSELPRILAWADQQKISIYFLGRGSNILIDDAGLHGLVVSTRNYLNKLWREENFIIAESGVFLPHLSKFAARLGFTGFEFLIGIPGTVGGALVMNAGLTVFRPREIVEIVEDFDVLNLDGSVETLTMQDINPGYRKTDLLEGNRLVLRVRFRLEDEADPEIIQRSTFEHLTERKRKQPLDKPTVGSTFKSPREGKSAGWYIDQAGLKGFQFGNARVSPIHANWIENLGGASSSDVCQLITRIQNTVKSRMGIDLEPEVRFLS